MKTSKNFEDSLARLNPNQRKAVEQTEGPVMVIAGPGTGKTQILSTRIAKILTLENQTQPDNILCLTFTNAGRTAMRQRLIELTDTPTANSVNIHTFHSFCNEVIQSRPEAFDYDLKLIDDLELVEILQKVQDTITQDSPIFRRRYKEIQIPTLKRVFEFIKKEDLDPDELISELKKFDAELDTHPDFVYKSNRGENKKGEPRLKLIAEERAKIEKAIARIELFPVYQELMKENGYYDYSDMIRWVIAALENNEDLKYDLLEKYQYILVDEFQDTNGAQFKLTELLSGYENNNAPNIFVVGDDDQSIYRFQGANMKNLLDFRNQYINDIKEVVLDENYRSSQAILQGAQHLIEQNKNRLIDAIPGLEKNLIASNPKVANLGVKPRVLQMVNAAQEYIHIAKDIEAKIKSGVAASDIAVLYPIHKFGNDFVKYLSALGIPFYMHKEMDFLKDPLAQMLLDLMTYIDSESREIDAYPNLLFQILAYPFWGAAKDTGFMILNSYRKHRESKESFRAYIHRWVAENSARENLKPWEESTIRVYGIIEQLILDAQQNSLPVLMNRIIMKTNLHAHILEKKNRFWNLEILKTLVEKCDEVYEKYPKDALQHLLQEFQLMENTGITMPVTKLMGTKSGVNMMSIHGSKGLEFKHVYMIASDENSWKDRNRGNDLTVPTVFFNEMMSNTTNVKDPEEKRRLFFVGVTRAEESLSISLPMADAQGKETAPVRFLTELQEGYDDLEPENVQLTAEEIQELEWSTLTQAHDLILEPSEKEILEERLQDYSMSVTGLYNFLDCPVNYYYNNLLRVPSGRSVSLDFGNMMHHTLENYYKEAKAKQEHLGADRLIQIYDKEVAKNAEQFVDEAAQEEIEIGRSDLKQLYEQKIVGTNLEIQLELKLKHTFDQGLQITGVIDKVEDQNGILDIIDYKTGKPDAAKVKAPNLSGRGKGVINNYWLQGFFYKLLIENSKEYQGKQIRDVKFLFLTPQEDKSFLEAPISVDKEQYDYTMAKVYEAWEKIKNLEFSEGCGKDNCYWCNYQKSIETN